MVKFSYQTIVQFEFDSDTGRTRVLKAFTTPIGSTAKGRQRGAKKIDFKGASSDGEVTL